MCCVRRDGEEAREVSFIYFRGSPVRVLLRVLFLLCSLSGSIVREEKKENNCNRTKLSTHSDAMRMQVVDGRRRERKKASSFGSWLCPASKLN